MAVQAVLGPGDDFGNGVIEVVRLIPVGRVSTYGAIARCLGHGRGARVVGWVLNHCSKLDVPAHRVVNRQGLLTGKMNFPSPDFMQNALEAEGIKVEKDQVVDFERLFWDPGEELGL